MSGRRPTALLFSRISGYGVYDAPEPLLQNDAFRVTSRTDKAIYTAYRNIESVPGEESIAETIAWLRYAVLNLPSCVKTGAVLWPVDVISPASGQTIYLLFKQSFKPEGFLPLRQLLVKPLESDELDWRNSSVLEYCLSLTKALADMEEAGYPCCDRSPDRILWHPEKNVCRLPFTVKIGKIQSEFNHGFFSPALLAKEFLPPYLVGKSEPQQFDKSVNDFQTAAMLFRLMIGRLPYEGRQMQHFGNVLVPYGVSGLQEDFYYRSYARCTYFIFSPDDSFNCLANVPENRGPKERWNALPDEVRALFLSAFEHPERGKTVPTVSEWLECLLSLKKGMKKILHG